VAHSLEIAGMSSLSEQQVLRLLVVRAVEEQAPGLLAKEDLSRAALAAVNSRDDAELLAKRSEYLFRGLPRPLQACAELTLFSRAWRWPLIGAAAVVGLLSNFLGPSGLVLVIYNPLTALLVWSICVYLVAGWHSFRSSAASVPASRHLPLASRSPARAQHRHHWAVWLLRPIYLKWLAYRARLRDVHSQMRDTARVAEAFWESQWEVAHPLMLSRVEHLLHLGAIGLLAGALAGTYLRGLFLEYHAIWQSTFVTSPGMVATILNVILFPACLVLDGHLLTAAAVQPLLLPTGTPAGPWIHKLALTAVVVVLLPRAVLVWKASRRAAAAAGDIRLDFSEPYFAQTLLVTREGQISRIRQGIADSLRRRGGELADSVASFVRDRFFDGIVKPMLISFRNNGGRIEELEKTLAVAAERFAPELSRKLEAGQQTFQRTVTEDIQTLLGRELKAPPNPGHSASSSPPELLGQMLPGNVAGGFADIIAGAVSGSVTAVVAAISGGIGKAVGVAIISHLLGTTGPIGLLIGGLAALGATLLGYVTVRGRVVEAIKSWHLPSLALLIPLRDAKIAEARDSTFAQVKQQIQGGIEPRITEITEEMLQQLSIASAGAAGA
jgi:hypothetical protein